MKILYASANIYHHMIPLANSIAKNVGIQNFRYAVLKPMEEYRIKMGLNAKSENQEYIIQVYIDSEKYLEFINWFELSDVVLFSDRSLLNLAKKRINNNKLTFYFSERWWKPNIGKWRLLHPKILYFAIQINKLSNNTYFHYLAQGGYAANDIRYISSFKDRIWTWGYFIDVNESEINELRKTNFRILWCGNMLHWKKVDTLIKAFARVINKEPKCHLTILGSGEKQKKLHDLARNTLPPESFEFLPSQPRITVRKYMRQSDIYVLPSTGFEGWGAVVNEAMAEGCAVIASIDAGAPKSIISHMKNGILFKSGNYIELSEKILFLIKNENKLKENQVEGKKTINELWSPEVAAFRFLAVCNSIISRNEVPLFLSGPMKKL